MVATSDFIDHGGYPINVSSLPLSVFCPRFLKRVRLLCRGDPESKERQDHCANTDVRCRAFTNMPALRASKNRKADVPIRPNSL